MNARPVEADIRFFWHRWFAWFPVLADNQWVWLECVERKGEYFSYAAGGHWEWKYRNER